MITTEFIKEKHLFNKTFLPNLLILFENYCIFSIFLENFLFDDKRCIWRYNILSSLSIKRESLDIQVVDNRWLFEETDILKFEDDYVMVILFIIFMFLAAKTEAWIINCIVFSHLFQFLLWVHVINVGNHLYFFYFIISEGPHCHEYQQNEWSK